MSSELTKLTKDKNEEGKAVSYRLNDFIGSLLDYQFFDSSKVKVLLDSLHQMTLHKLKELQGFDQEKRKYFELLEDIQYLQELMENDEKGIQEEDLKKAGKRLGKKVQTSFGSDKK